MAMIVPFVSASTPDLQSSVSYPMFTGDISQRVISRLGLLPWLRMRGV